METRLALSAVSVQKGRRNLTSPVLKHSIAVAGHKTSVSLEDRFWDGLREIARREGVTTTELIERIDTERTRDNLSSAIRIFVLRHFRDRLIGHKTS
jgi:predicted DNA-binding ribbon-helix-helix protein